MFMPHRSVAVMRFPGVDVVQVDEGEVAAVTPSMPAPGPACPPVTGRWLDHLHLGAYVNVDGPTCEEMEARTYHRPGPIGDVMAGRPAPGNRMR